MSYQRNNNTPQHYECRADFGINGKWMNPSADVAGVSLSKALTRISRGNKKKKTRSRSETGGRTKKRGALGCPFGKTGWWNVLLWLIRCSCRVCDPADLCGAQNVSRLRTCCGRSGLSIHSSPAVRSIMGSCTYTLYCVSSVNSQDFMIIKSMSIDTELN